MAAKLPLMKSVLKFKSVLILLGLSAVMSAADATSKKKRFMDQVVPQTWLRVQ